MLCSIQSSDPLHYNTVRMNIDIPWNTPYIKYHVSSINTVANILLSTKEDVIKFLVDGKEYRIPFDDKYNYSINSLLSCLNEHQTFDAEINPVNAPLLFKLNEHRCITIVANNNVTIESVPHRIAMLMGLYNTPLPIVLNTGDIYHVQDIPILNLSNKLYLVSLQGQAIHSSIGNKEYTPSVIANIDTMIIDEAPIMVNFDGFGKPIKTKINTDGLKQIEMRLVDFQYQPVELRSPLFVTLIIKPCRKPLLDDMIAK